MFQAEILVWHFSGSEGWMGIEHMVCSFLHSLWVAPLHPKTLSQLQMLVQQYLYHCQVTAEDTCGELPCAWIQNLRIPHCWSLGFRDASSGNTWGWRSPRGFYLLKRLDDMCCANLSKAKKWVLPAFLAEVYGSRKDSMLGNTLITLTL